MSEKIRLSDCRNFVVWMVPWRMLVFGHIVVFLCCKRTRFLGNFEILENGHS